MWLIAYTKIKLNLLQTKYFLIIVTYLNLLISTLRKSLIIIYINKNEKTNLYAK